MRTVRHPILWFSFTVAAIIAGLSRNSTEQVVFIIVTALLTPLARDTALLWKRSTVTIAPICVVLVIVGFMIGDVPPAELIVQSQRTIVLLFPIFLTLSLFSSFELLRASEGLPFPSSLRVIILYSLELIESTRLVYQSAVISLQLRGVPVTHNRMTRWKALVPILVPTILAIMNRGLAQSLAMDFKRIDHQAVAITGAWSPSTTEKWISAIIVLATLFWSFA